MLIFSYPEWNSGIAFNDDAEALGAITSDGTRLCHGVNYVGDSICWYCIDLQWLQLSHNIVDMVGSSVCLCPVDAKAVADFYA